MSYTKLRSYGVNAVGDIIPLDRESCQDLVDFTISLANDKVIESHLLGILGESEVSLEFIKKFLQLKHEEDESQRKLEAKLEKQRKKQVLNTPPIPSTTSTSDKKVPAWTVPGAVKPPVTKGRLQLNTTSKTTSQLLDIKPSNQPNPNQVKRSKKKNLSSLQDIEAALTDLELADTDMASSGEVRRYCNCMATRHPLFEVAPNCLKCGKIICQKEGLQPCSFCGSEILSAKDKYEIKRVLQQEKDDLMSKQANLKPSSSVEDGKKSKPKKITVSTASGGNFWDAQAKALEKAENERKKQQQQVEQLQREKEQLAEQEEELKHYEQIKDVDAELLKAQERLNILLEFQATGTERTKIIDRAADFEMPSLSSTNVWLSPVERALQLKKQQKQLRKHESSKASRTGRSKKVVEMVIKDGKVTMVENDKFSKSDDEDLEEIKQLENELKNDKIQNEQLLSKNVWDYEQDKHKWEKPVYIKHNDTPIAQSDEEDVILKSRIQMSTMADDLDLVASLPS